MGTISLLWADIIASTLLVWEDTAIGIISGLLEGVFFWLLGCLKRWAT
ncbi:MAG: iron chelate uptake ABC superfamily ATP binding cassette transporter [Rhodobacteraceae bacterium]|nr:MAG: iron chelate uptake ABC superfamily ATP binding cassette transporter [Paracoccaceae bacterium]